MFQKYIYSDGMSKVRKLYIIAAITIPIVVAVVVLAWAEGDLVFARVFGVGSMIWIALALYSSRKFSRRQETEETLHIDEKTPQHRRLMVFFKTTSFLILVSTMALLVGVIIYSSHLYFALAALLCIITAGNAFIFVSLLTDE